MRIIIDENCVIFEPSDIGDRIVMGRLLEMFTQTINEAENFMVAADEDSLEITIE